MDLRACLRTGNAIALSCALMAFTAAGLQGQDTADAEPAEPLVEVPASSAAGGGESAPVLPAEGGVETATSEASSAESPQSSVAQAQTRAYQQPSTVTPPQATIPQVVAKDDARSDSFIPIAALAVSVATLALLVFMMLQRRPLKHELVLLRQELSKDRPAGDGAPAGAALKQLQDGQNALAIDLRSRLEPLEAATAKLLQAIESLRASPAEAAAERGIAADSPSSAMGAAGSWWPRRGALAELAEHIRSVAPEDPQGSPAYYAFLRQYYELASLRQAEDKDTDRWSVALHKFTEAFCRHLHAAWEHEDAAWEVWETHDEKLRESLLELVAELNLPLHVQVIRRDDIFDHERMIKDSSGASSALRVRFPLSWIIGLKQNDRVKLLHRGLVIT